MKTLKHFLFAGILGSSGLASANAFNVNEHDAAVTGRGGATAATNTSASSIVFNPGGIAAEAGTSFTIGGTAYFAAGSYETNGEKTATDSDPSIVPALYFKTRLGDVFAIGVGFHLPFGLAVSWPDAHPQSQVIQDQALRTYFITPSIGFNLDKAVPGLSIGGGLDIVPATVQLERAVLFGDAEGTAVLGGKATGIGGRAGIMYNPRGLKGLHLGVMWRSQVKLDFEGDGDFDIEDPYRAQLPPDGPISTTVTLPQQVWGGLAFDASPNLQLEYNAVWINWDKFEELRISLPGGVDTVQAQNYRNTVSHRLGLEYQRPKVALRAGFVYDPTPIPSSTLSAQLPDVDRKNVTFGGSAKLGDNMALHLGFLWVTPGERDTSNENPYAPQFKATYGVQAFVGSLALSGTFGGGAGSKEPSPSASTEVAAR
jgi:long-chain fatty acid transport protein